MKVARLAWVAMALSLAACAEFPTTSVSPQAGAPSPAASVAPAAPVASVAPRVTSREARARIEAGEAMVIVDVRSAAAFQAEHIEGAVNIPLSALKDRYAELPKDKTILLYCTCPAEASSAAAARELHGYGYDKLLVLLVGLNDWAAQGYPVTKAK